MTRIGENDESGPICVIRGSPAFDSCLFVSIRGCILLSLFLSGNCGAKFSKIFKTSEESNHEWTRML